MQEIAIVIAVRFWRVALLKRLNHQPTFPGGKVNPDETPYAAARRELFEETGLTAREYHYIHSAVDPSSNQTRHYFFCS